MRIRTRVETRLVAMVGGTMCCATCLGSSATGNIIPFTEEAMVRNFRYEVQPWQGPTQQFQGFGCAIADINGNGHQDIVVMGAGDGVVGVFENDGTGHFINRTDTSGIPALPKASGIAMADYNGNGLLDIYITQQFHFANILARNDGQFTFTDVGEAAGVANPDNGHSEGAAWGDYDNDGWLDLYVCNYTFSSDNPNPLRRNQFYRNRADGTFDSIGAQLGIDNPGMSFTAVWSDINRNGKVDLHMVNDRGHLPPNYNHNRLWRNEGGTFTDISASSGADLGLWSMCIAAGDFNGNGYPDFYITNLPNIGGYGGINPLLINQGDETFIDQTTEAGVQQFIFSWAGVFFDYDNNGHLDLYVCNQGQANRLYSNNGTFPTSDVTTAAGVGGSPGFSFNAAVGDVTGNGAMDLVLNNYATLGYQFAQLFINHEGAQRNWIRYNVVGDAGNRRAIGANIDTRAGDRWQWREIYAGGNNFKSQNELVFHVGLDDAEIADEIVVSWPGGTPTRTLYNYPANHVWTIYPPQRLGDLNGDGTIGKDDLVHLLMCWGPVTPGAEMMDINGDGQINVSDLLLLLQRWNEGR